MNAAFQLGIGEQPLGRSVLPLEILQPLSIVGLQPADLITPPVVGLLGNLQLTADIGDVLTLNQKPTVRRWAIQVGISPARSDTAPNASQRTPAVPAATTHRP